MVTEAEYPSDYPEQDSNYYYPEKQGMFDADTIRHIISNDEILHQIELKLAGLRETETGGLERIGEPKLNREGIATVINIISAISNKNTHLTNYDKHFEIGLLKDLNYKLNRILLQRKLEYGVKDIMEINLIVFPLAIASIRRGVDESDKSFLRGSFHHGTAYGNVQKKRGLFSFFKR